jgi:hypothetical protein
VSGLRELILETQKFNKKPIVHKASRRKLVDDNNHVNSGSIGNTSKSSSSSSGDDDDDIDASGAFRHELQEKDYEYNFDTIIFGKCMFMSFMKASVITKVKIDATITITSGSFSYLHTICAWFSNNCNDK